MERYDEFDEEREIQETNAKRHDIPRGWQPSPETITAMKGQTEKVDNELAREVSVENEYRPALDKERLVEHEPGTGMKPFGVGAPDDSLPSDTSISSPPADDTGKPIQNETREEDQQDLDELKRRDEEYRQERLAELRQKIRNLENK